ncbi:iron complex outermembrane receptor protein [Sphingomonas jinjuensis]|uniref:Iron complex outermembrane receptor protein n=1 Tax=Sphingomonas jinjuensis TaxID=535907 RepID=A0A840F2N8_9SPHN|nr:TonB-dependent receptor [Sphingomonas jinjuensis]MBB4153613.1 iron complex outermembrane receptor protein [Sphingomonas jinjuensis]
MSLAMLSLRHRARLGVALGAMLASMPAYAQTTAAPADQTGAATADEGETVVVTGSRIRRDPLAQAAPLTTIDNADIARTGLSSIGDVLQRLPGSAGGLNSRFNRSGNNGNPPDGGGVGAGSAEIDLRYLGSRRTLVLLDGQRFINGTAASGVPGAVDLNAIPDSMVERIEVLRDGASTTYGSDAIAGVVNIITRKRQNGFLASAQVGAYPQGDGVTQNYQLSWGHRDEGAGVSFVAGVNYIKQGSVFAGDRPYYSFPNPGATACTTSCSSGTPNGRFLVNNPVTGVGMNLTLKSNPLTTPRFDPANPTGANSDFKQFTVADRFNFRPYNYLLTPQERFGAFINFQGDLGDSVRFSTKVIYNRRTSDNQAAPLPLFVGPDAGNGNLLDTISIDRTNPFNPFGVTLAAGNAGLARNYDFIGRRFVENGPRHYSQEVNTMYIGSTLDGQIPIGAGTWYWDANVIYAENSAKQVAHGNVNAANLARALGPISQCTGSCVPFNIFGGAGSITPAMINYVTFEQRDRSEQAMVDATFNVTGTLFNLPAGPLGLAAGYEYRKQIGSFTPDPIVAAGLGSDIPAQATRGGFDVNEVYAELSIPVLKDVPFFRLLEGSFAARYSDYSTSGSRTTMKGGLSWKPINDLRLRGTWAQGFRAPSIGELFGTPSRFDGGVIDPCSDFNNNGASATVKQNCIARGVPANGSYVQTNQQLPILTGGNRALRPETSESWVVGGVYSPSWANGIGRLTLEADYYTITVDNAISSIGADVLLANCTQTNDPVACGAITRSTSGAITQIRGLLQNIASLKSEGLDLILSYRSPSVGAGTFGLTWSSNVLFEYSTTLPTATGSSKLERQGTERGDQAYPRFKSNATLDWSSAAFTAALTGRYIGRVTEPAYDNRVMHPILYLDAQVGWTPGIWDQRLSLTLGVNNILGKRAPDCLSCGGFDPTTYDLPDQFGYARIALKF